MYMYKACFPVAFQLTPLQKLVCLHACQYVPVHRDPPWAANKPVLVITCTAWVYNAEAEHNAHLDHLRTENDGHLPEAPAYDYLNKRAKPFPWGMNSLFFNSHVSLELEHPTVVNFSYSRRRTWRNLHKFIYAY